MYACAVHLLSLSIPLPRSLSGFSNFTLPGARGSAISWPYPCLSPWVLPGGYCVAGWWLSWCDLIDSLVLDGTDRHVLKSGHSISCTVETDIGKGYGFRVREDVRLRWGRSLSGRAYQGRNRS